MCLLHQLLFGGGGSSASPPPHQPTKMVAVATSHHHRLLGTAPLFSLLPVASLLLPTSSLCYRWPAWLVLGALPVQRQSVLYPPPLSQAKLSRRATLCRVACRLSEAGAAILLLTPTPSLYQLIRCHFMLFTLLIDPQLQMLTVCTETLIFGVAVW